MSRSVIACKKCGAQLGARNESGIFHRANHTAITFVDFLAGTATLQCSCGATMQYRGGRLDLRGASDAD